MKKKASMIAIASLVIAVAAVATLAAVLYNNQIPNTVTITGYGIELWNTKTSTAVTSINWGSLLQGTNETTEQVFSTTQEIFVKNTGSYALYAEWNITGTDNAGLPTGVTLTAQQYAGGHWVDWAQDSSLEEIAGGATGIMPVRFTLTISAGATIGTYSNFCTINLYGDGVNL